MGDILYEGWDEIKAFLKWTDHKIRKYRPEMKRHGIVFRVVEKYGANPYPKPRVKAYQSRLIHFH